MGRRGATRRSASQDTWPPGPERSTRPSARERTPKGGPTCSLSLRRLFPLYLCFFAAPAVPSPASVVDSSGRARAARVVQVVQRDGTIAATVFTDADGAFRVADGAGRLPRAGVAHAASSPRTAECRTDTPLEADARRRAGGREHRRVGDTDRSARRPGRVRGHGVRRGGDRSGSSSRCSPISCAARRGRRSSATGAPGTVTSLFVRGGESNYTKVLLDGIPLNEPGGAFNLSNVTTENLERVEFVRGANSALYGSDAMTGVIQLFTRRGTRDDARRTVADRGRQRLEPARGSAGVAGEGRRASTIPRTSAGFTTDNEAPNNEFRNTTLSGSAGARARPRRDAALRRPRRARARPARPARPHSAGPIWTRSTSATTASGARRSIRDAGALHQRAAYGLAVSHQASTNLAARSALHADVRGTHRAVRVLGLRLRQPHRSAASPRELPGGRHDHDGQRRARTSRRRSSTGKASARR